MFALKVNEAPLQQVLRRTKETRTLKIRGCGGTTLDSRLKTRDLGLAPRLPSAVCRELSFRYTSPIENSCLFPI
jgi:hypothetical protein